MRDKCAKQDAMAEKSTLHSHPWFHELMTKVVVLNGTPREITENEKVVLEQIQRYYRFVIDILLASYEHKDPFLSSHSSKWSDSSQPKTL